MKKNTKIILITTSIILFASAIGVLGYFIYKNIYKSNNNHSSNNQQKPEESIPSTSEIKEFKTIDLSNEYNKSINPSIEVNVIDVGQADSILIRTSADGTFNDLDKTYNILIDAGNSKQESNKSIPSRPEVIEGQINTPNFNSKLKNYLDYKNINNDKIDLFVISHADADHIGGMVEAINLYSKQNESVVLGYSDNEKTTKTWQNTLSAIASNNLIYIDPFLKTALDNPIFSNSMSSYKKDGKWNFDKLYSINKNTNIIKWSDTNFFSYICPSYDYNANKPNETNESSINNYLIWNDYRFLFSGDSEGVTHNDLIDTLKENKDLSPNGNLQKIDFYKVAHHGSTTKQSNNQEFLSSILDNKSKLLISENDDKLYSGSPTFTKQFMTNLLNVFGNTPLEPMIYTTQDLGDITISINKDNINTENNILISSLTREENSMLWSLPSSKVFSTNHSQNYLEYRKWFK